MATGHLSIPYKEIRRYCRLFIQNAIQTITERQMVRAIIAESNPPQFNRLDWAATALDPLTIGVYGSAHPKSLFFNASQIIVRMRDSGCLHFTTSPARRLARQLSPAYIKRESQLTPFTFRKCYFSFDLFSKSLSRPTI